MNTKKLLYRILFLCTGNSARSIFAEFLLRKIAPNVFETYSAGSSPQSSPHPLALQVLEKHYQIDVTAARSKSWREFQDRPFDLVITLCDDAKETCPIWPGQPIIAHWPSPDPAKFEGSEEELEKAFWQVAQQIHRRLGLLASFPFEKLDALSLETKTKEIGKREEIMLHASANGGVMKLEAFRETLSVHSDKNLTFILPDGDLVPAHAHVTEVGITQKHFLDCGGKLRNQSFVSLQIWVAEDTEHRLPAGKLSSIFDKAEKVLGTDNPEVQVECQDGSIKLFAVSGFEVRGDLLSFSLANKQTACLAMEICVPEASGEEARCSTETGYCS